MLSTIILREWQANDAACLQCMISAAGWAFYGVHRLQSSIAAEKFGVEHRGQSFSGTRAVSCCFSTSLSPAPVSEPSTPHPSTLV